MNLVYLQFKYQKGHNKIPWPDLRSAERAKLPIRSYRRYPEVFMKYYQDLAIL